MYTSIAGVRLVIASILLLFWSAAGAQQPTAADFYAAYAQKLETIRPAIFASPKTPEDTRLVATLPRVKGELEAMVRRLVGPLSTPKGFAGNGHWNDNWDYFEKGVSGIGFSQGEPIADYPYVLVSTLDLLRQWPLLPPEVRADPEALFRDGLQSADEIMFKAIWSVTIGFLSIKTPPGVDTAFATVTTSGNGFLGVWPPREISLYMRRGDRIYIASVRPDMEFPPTLSCGVDLRAALKIADPVPLRLLAKRCWEGGGKNEPATAAATRQAQQFIDDLAER